MDLFKSKLLDMSCLLKVEDCQKYITKENIDNYIKIFEDEIKKYLIQGNRRKELNLRPTDLTDNPPANARWRYRKVLKQINKYQREVGRPILKYNQDSKEDMAKVLKIYFIIVEVELVNIKTRIAIYRSRLNMLNKIKDKL